MQPSETAPEASTKPPKKAPLTDAERHKRFVAMVGEVEASTDASDFDAAFKALDKRQK